jgi:hypothetical protein
MAFVITGGQLLSNPSNQDACVLSLPIVFGGRLHVRFSANNEEKGKRPLIPGDYASLAFVGLKKNASWNFAARPHREKSEEQRRQDPESHAYASFPLPSFTELLPGPAGGKALPASADRFPSAIDGTTNSPAGCPGLGSVPSG